MDFYKIPDLPEPVVWKNERVDDEPLFPDIADFYSVQCVTGGRFFINELFAKKFRSNAPSFGKHFIGFYRRDDGSLLASNYIHIRPCGSIMLFGGGMTDEHAVRQMSQAHRKALKAAGGIFYVGISTVVHHLAAECEAFMGYTGNTLSHQTASKVGFVDTRYPHLVVNFHKPLSKRRKNKLIEQANSLGAF